MHSFQFGKTVLELRLVFLSSVVSMKTTAFRTSSPLQKVRDRYTFLIVSKTDTDQYSCFEAVVRRSKVLSSLMV
jgi:hypothetical protein